MSVEFHSTPFLDVAIFSGKKVYFEKQLESSHLIGQAREKALHDLESSYERHRRNLSKMSYKTFISKAQKAYLEIKEKTTLEEIRQGISKKLETLSKTEIDKEKAISKIRKFFKRLGNFFNGYGFRTAGEYGLKLSEKIKKTPPQKTLENQVIEALSNPHYFESEKTDQLIENQLAELQKAINGIPKDQFFSLTRSVLRLMKPNEQKAILLFYQKLSPEKKQLFDSMLIHWWGFSRVYHFANYLDPKQYSELISPTMVKEFLHQKKLLEKGKTRVEEMMNHPNKRIHDLYRALFESAIKNALDKGDFPLIDKLFSEGSVRLEKIKKNPLVLTPSDIEKLNKNLNLSAI